jgi:Tol biopolymer transport system component
MPMSGDRRSKLFLSSKYSELNGTFSPDSRWVTYQSNASGRDEVLVRPFPDKDPAQTISRDGGTYPRWRGLGVHRTATEADDVAVRVVDIEVFRAPRRGR